MKTEARRTLAIALGVGCMVLGAAHRAGADIAEEIAATRALAEMVDRKLRNRTPVVPVSERGQAMAAAAAHSFTGPRIRETMAPRATLDRLINETALRYGVTPAFVRAVVAAESGYDVRARSPKGAMGLMQLMPGTASALGVRDPWDPAENVEGGVRFLAGLLAEFRDPEAALVGYNAGPEVVRRGWRIPEETRAYVRTVMTYFRRFRDGSSAR